MIIVVIIIYLVGSMLGSFKLPFGKGDDKQNEATFPDLEPTETDLDKDEQEDESDTASEETVEMIKLLGKEADKARKELKEMGLDLHILGREASDEYEEGKIVTQSVEEGESVETGTTIQVTVSSGPDDFEMPKVVGNPSATARDMLTARGLVVDPDSAYEYSDSPEGTVLRQSPEAGAMVKKGDTVKLTISKGVQQVQVPDLRKQTQDYRI